MFRFKLVECFLVLFLISLTYSCKTIDNNRVTEFTSANISCFIVNSDGKTDKLDGKLRSLQDQFIRISFRAPVINSELFLLEYTPSGLLLINRKSKQYCILPNPEKVSLDGKFLPNYELLSERMAQVTAGSLKNKYSLDADSFGLGVLGDSTTVELSKISFRPFPIQETSLSNKYEKVSFEAMLNYLFE